MNTPLPKPEDLSESAAGEEDPGSAMDVIAETSVTGEQPCADCGGTGKRAGVDCAMCHGTGRAATA